METFEIECLVNKALDGSRRRGFLGVFARDRLPRISRSHFPCCYVANTDDSSKSGTHWVAFYHVTPNHCEFFDSYGKNPSFYLFTQHCQLHNSLAIQRDTSETCGHHCVNFIIHRIRDKRLTPQRYVEILYNRFKTKYSIDAHVKSSIESLSHQTGCRTPPCPAAITNQGSQCCRARCSVK
jgi:hypothetical protein